VRGSVKAPGWASLMTLVSDTAYHSFIGEVEALNTTTIRRLTRSRRHQLPAIALAPSRPVVFHTPRREVFCGFHPSCYHLFSRPIPTCAKPSSANSGAMLSELSEKGISRVNRHSYGKKRPLRTAESPRNVDYLKRSYGSVGRASPTRGALSREASGMQVQVLPLA